MSYEPTHLLHGVCGHHAEDDRHARRQPSIQHAARCAADNRVEVRSCATHLRMGAEVMKEGRVTSARALSMQNAHHPLLPLADTYQRCVTKGMHGYGRRA